MPDLAPGRVHECMGPAAAAFAARRAAARPGTVIWIAPEGAETLLPAGLAPILPPGRLIRIAPATETDLLWAAEECLRSGAAGTVVAQPQKPLGLTPGRRLQLAAAAGRATGILIIRDGAGSPAAETRWQCEPLWDAADSTRARWCLIKNKSGTLAEWTVRADEATGALLVVSAAGQREVAADPPG
ncbi:MAG: hypothetical protein IE927_15690 [Rhodobacterales bacterium]|nr:hypothetical protein [Rhodobacterales bacterium]